jgi:membrane protease YdiL (CAAX protease family)
LIWWLARWQGPGPARRRLALARPRRRDALAWLLAVLAFGWLYERVVVWLDRPPLPPVMDQVFRTAGWLPALVVAVVALAPAFEELAFRGFCLGGLAPLGALPAIGVSSALFAVIHVQYDLFDVGAVLVLGALFGAARWQSGSTLLTLGLHAFHTALASFQALWVVGGAAP